MRPINPDTQPPGLWFHLACGLASIYLLHSTKNKSGQEAVAAVLLGYLIPTGYWLLRLLLALWLRWETKVEPTGKWPRWLAFPSSPP